MSPFEFDLNDLLAPVKSDSFTLKSDKVKTLQFDMPFVSAPWPDLLV